MTPANRSMENQQILAKYANGWHASDTIGKIAEVM